MTDDAPNFDLLDLTSQHLQHRAIIQPDGSVSLIADAPGMTISIAGQPDTQATEIPLSPAEFARLHEMSGPPDKMLHYDQTKRKFGVKTIKPSSDARP